MFNSFTSWLNTLPIPLPKASAQEETADNARNDEAQHAEPVTTELDKPVESTHQLELKEVVDESPKANEVDTATKIQLEAQAALETAKEFSKEFGSMSL